MKYQAPDPLRLLHQVNPLVPAAAAVVVARAMALDREARFPSAAAMREALREAGHLIATTTPEAQLLQQQSKRRTEVVPVAPPPRAQKAIIIGAALALPVVVLAIYFAFIAGRSTGNNSGNPTTITNGMVITSGVTEIQGPVKLPTGIAPPGSIASFDFETVTLDESGNEKSREKKQARHFGESLGGEVVLELVEIPGGSFLIGSPKEEEGRIPTENPQRRVTLQSFWMGKYEVTQEQWREVAKLPKVRTDFSPDPSLPIYKHAKTPVSGVSRDHAVEFCERLSRKTGRAYRLPSEAEWEYAARAGTTTPFAFGPVITPAVANCSQKRPATVGSLGVANAFGLFDMHGNMWEWCQDERRDDYSGLSADGSWTKEGDQRFRVLRGGCWGLTETRLCRSAMRYHDAPDARNYINELDVLVEAPAEVYADQDRLVQLEKRLSHEVQSALGITCIVKLVGPREIERSEGKAVRVVDKRRL